MRVLSKISHKVETVQKPRAISKTCALISGGLSENLSARKMRGKAAKVSNEYSDHQSTTYYPLGNHHL